MRKILHSFGRSNRPALVQYFSRTALVAINYLHKTVLLYSCNNTDRSNISNFGFTATIVYCLHTVESHKLFCSLCIVCSTCFTCWVSSCLWLPKMLLPLHEYLLTCRVTFDALFLANCVRRRRSIRVDQWVQSHHQQTIRPQAAHQISLPEESSDGQWPWYNI